MTTIEYTSVREKLTEEKAKLTHRLEQIQRALNELASEAPSSSTDDRLMALDKGERIASGILARQPTVFSKLAQ
jgi:hypothetical protein